MAMLRRADLYRDLYLYQPVVELSVISAGAFMIVVLAHAYIFLRRKTWFFWPMLIGTIMECVGFVARATSVSDQSGVFPFLLSYLMLILAPCFVTAACYVLFGRLVWWVVPIESRNFSTLWMPPRYLTFLFVGLDIASFCIQLLGASKSGSAYTEEKMSTTDRQYTAKGGMDILRLGLVLQTIGVVVFSIISTRFIFISHRWHGRRSRYGVSNATWAVLVYVATIAMAVVMVRTLYQIVESSSPRDMSSYVHSHEWPFWAFDAIPMLGLLILCLIFHPSRYLPRELSGLRLDAVQLNDVELCNPPTYAESQNTEAPSS